MGMIRQLDKVACDEFIKQDKVIVDFWATWCGPCMKQGQLIEAEAEKDAAFAGKIGKVNVDEERDLAVSYGVSAIPTLIVFSQGAEVKRFVGMQSIATLKAELN
ncbi:MAG: thioredoxin fold domain-containing protein [Victivallales bacterium]|nr:thioredoxin fold domain-containing protein [Victivallales bacterium]